MTYSEKLKDPRWQKKRLKVLRRDNWCCKICLDTETTLHIHHKKYTNEPWDAPMEDLQTLCEDCHRNIKWLKYWDDNLMLFDSVPISKRENCYQIPTQAGYVFYDLSGEFLLNLTKEQIKALHRLTDPEYREMNRSENIEL